VPIWLIVFLVSVIVYAISFILIRTISRYREYAADRGSAIITGAPENLMSALQKISSGITQIPQRDLREVQGMNAFFIIPTNWKTNMSEWMMDHPPLEKRLAALSEIAREMGKPSVARERASLAGISNSGLGRARSPQPSVLFCLWDALAGAAFVRSRAAEAGASAVRPAAKPPLRGCLSIRPLPGFW
jgi:hypothetical protein